MPSAGYSQTPLAKKLGIAPAAVLVLVGAPDGFERELEGLPANALVARRLRRGPDLIVWFVPSKRQLHARIKTMAREMGAGLWIAWPKQSSGVATDLTEHAVRAAGLAQGLVDYKVCAINATWSGLKFARRK